MKRKIIALYALLTFSMAAMAQSQRNVVGYNKDNNTLTTVHYYYGSVDKINVAGRTLTSIALNGQGLPTEMTNDYATMTFSWAGTRSVTVTQTINGQTKTDQLNMPDGVVIDYRNEYQKYKQNPSAIDKIDRFLAGGGAKLVGGIIGTVIDMLDNPIGACFDQALEAGKASEKSIIPINDLQALQMASNLNKTVADRMKDAAVNAIFENYKEWTNEWSDMVYKWQLEKYRQQKADNRISQEWRLGVATALLDRGKSLKEVSQFILDLERRNVASSGGSAKSGGSAASNGSGSSSGSGSSRGSGSGDRGGSDNTQKPSPDAQFDVIGYVKNHFKNSKRGLPPEITAEWVRYKVWGYHRLVNYTLNPDKKTYTEQVIMEGGEHDMDEYDNPHIYVSFNGNGWGQEPALHIPLPPKKK